MKNKIFEKLTEHDKRFVKIDERFTKIDRKLTEHDMRLERIEGRLDKTLTREEYLAGYDEMITILRRLDQERIFTTEWIKRVEDEVNQQKQQIQRHQKLLDKIKAKLKITV